MEDNSSSRSARHRPALKYVRQLRVSPGLIVALVALFVALGGTAAAKDAGRTMPDRVVSVVRVSDVVQPQGFGRRVAMCPRGYAATGGGVQHFHDYTRPDAYDWEIYDLGPKVAGDDTGEYFSQPGLRSAPRGWGATMRNRDAVEGRFVVSVVCTRTV